MMIGCRFDIQQSPTMRVYPQVYPNMVVGSLRKIHHHGMVLWYASHPGHLSWVLWGMRTISFEMVLGSPFNCLSPKMGRVVYTQGRSIQPPSHPNSLAGPKISWSVQWIERIKAGCSPIGLVVSRFCCRLTILWAGNNSTKAVNQATTLKWVARYSPWSGIFGQAISSTR